MSLPASVAGRAVRDRRRVSGGMLNEAWRLALEDGEIAFVKTRGAVAPGEYAAEARGLCWLGEPGALRTPEVLEAREEWLALAWVEPGSLSAAGEEELGRGLAATHATGAEVFGAEAPLRFGALGLPNAPRETFAAFYAENRLAPLLPRAGLGARGRVAVERVIGRIDELAGPPEPPARVHGDLWSGNVLAGADGRPWLIDPVAHGGHREVDLAMLALFGPPGPRVLPAYREAAPLADGWEERVPLWQLFPLLVHAVLFGGGYGARAEAAAAAASLG